MLELWQKKYPRAFEIYADIMLETKSIKLNLSNLFTRLDEMQSLNDDMVERLLELHYSSAVNIIDLQQNLSEMINHTLLSLDISTLLCKSPNPIKCMQFILQARANNIDMESIHRLLAKQSIMDGLGGAMIVFEQGHFEYSLENLHHFSILAEVLANPLSQAIFDARTRTFSDYSIESEERIDSKCAEDIINQLHAEQNSETRISVFFNILSELRPFSPSQKHRRNKNVADDVLVGLTSYCEKIINEINSPEDYERARSMVKKLQQEGGDQTIFDQIKYPVARTIVSEDLYSTLSYEQLMDTIKCALFKPQTDLSSFSDELESSPWHQRSSRSAVSHLSLLKAPKQRLEGEHLAIDEPLNKIAKR